MGSSIRSARAWAVAALCALSATASSHAQRPANVAPRGFATVSGRVETPGVEKQVPIAGVMVTVHRVGTDSSGPVDSVRTDANGRYSIRYDKFGEDAAAVYFAAAVYRGIAYFSAPLQSARAVGDEAEITVFDTTSKPVVLHVQGHHVVVSSPHPDGTRNIVEVWELSNDTTVTVVGRDTLTPVWSHVLPAGAEKFAGGPGDVAAAALAVRGDSAVLLSVFGPGVKQISYTYTLPASSFPLALAITKQTSVLEVLVEEVAAQVTGATLRSTAAATTQGRTFKRWLGQDVAVGQVINISVPTTSAALRSRVLIGIATLIVLAMTAALVLALRARGKRVAVVSHASTRDTLLASIASLDARHERGDDSLGEAQYAEQRAHLKSQLAALLASGSGAV